MNYLRSHPIASVLAAHYVSAFTALGMPIFMPRVLAQLAPGAPAWLAGVLYVLPTLCTALTAPVWGALADRYGRRLSLLRAQAGLALGFALAGFAPNLTWFVLALIMQGSCGGSLAAANAYLSTQAQGDSLAQALDWTQFSTRLAMVTAPGLLGLATSLGFAQELYRYLALLPLLAFALTTLLPVDHVNRTPVRNDPRPSTTWRAWGGLLLVQFLFYFAMVVTFPYFIPYAERLGIHSDSLAGLLYSLPHLAYLLALPWLRRVGTTLRQPLPTGLVLFSLACLLQALLNTPRWLAPTRLLYGIGMLLAISGINHVLAKRTTGAGAGRSFGLFDACGKWAGALGGLAAGLLVQRDGLAAPFLAAALAGAGALTATFYLLRIEKRQSYVPASDA